MSNWCIVNENSIIENIIYSDEAFANGIGAKPFYDGASIGSKYDPPEVIPEPTIDERVESLESENALLKAQTQALSDSNEFLEDCIAEMAAIVYA